MIVKGKYQINDEWNYLIEDCRAIISQRIKNSRIEIILAYAEIGKRIVEDPLYNKYGKGNQKFLFSLCKEIGISGSSGYFAIQFYERFIKKYIFNSGDVYNALYRSIQENFLDERDNISWFKIVNKHLSAPKPEKPEIPPLPTRPKIYYCDYKDFLYKIENNSQDLLITDPPYSTDIENIEEFANDWVIKALDKVKPTGRAFICIGAYPRELKAYLDILLSQDKFILDNPLIWTYRNTLGQTPKMKYNLNYQIILHLYSKQSRKLDTKITNEMFSVQDINAPDGRQGNRYHTWQKPSELARRLITHTTQEGDEIFDCFGGTGTFVLVGAQLGRKVMGCDNSREMLKIAEERGCEII